MSENTDMGICIDIAIEKYIKDVKSLLVCDRKLAKSFIKEFEHNVRTFSDERSVFDIDRVIKQFGTPEEVAYSFLDTLDIKTIKKRMDIKRCVKAGVMTALLLWTGCLTVLFVDSCSDNHEYFVEEMVSFNNIQPPITE